MRKTQVILSILAISASFVGANNNRIYRSLITLPISKRINNTGIHNLVLHDKARSMALKFNVPVTSAGGQTSLGCATFPVTDQGAISYLASVGIGSPATTYSLIVDTGSSNTWIGAGKSYVKTSTSVQTANKVAVTYGSGSFIGDEFTDTVAVGPGLVIKEQSIGVATSTAGFFDVDGVLGMGPVDLTVNTLSPASSSEIPTIVDNLFSNHIIGFNGFSISFSPATSLEQANGEIIWGGLDVLKFIGPLSFSPITSISPASSYWGINQSIRYGASTTILTTTAGIIDTGTTLILIATDTFNRYQSATGAVLDASTGLLRIMTAQLTNLQSLFFVINQNTFELTPNAQLWPRTLNALIGGASGSIYLVVNDIGTPTGRGFDFINGQMFLERFYSVFDTTNKQVGLAVTPYTNAMTN